MTEVMGNRMKGSSSKVKTVKAADASEQSVDGKLEVESKNAKYREKASECSVNAASHESNGTLEHKDIEMSQNKLLMNADTEMDETVKIAESESGTYSCERKYISKPRDSCGDSGEDKQENKLIIEPLEPNPDERKPVNLKSNTIETETKRKLESEDCHAVNSSVKTDRAEKHLNNLCLEKERQKPKDIGVTELRSKEESLIKKDVQDRSWKNEAFKEQTNHNFPYENNKTPLNAVELEIEEKLKQLIESLNSEESNLTEILTNITRIVKGQQGENLYSELHIAALIKYRFTKKFERYLTKNGIHAISEINFEQCVQGKKYWPTVKRFLMLVWIACDQSVNFCQHILTSNLFQTLQTDLKRLCFSKYADSEVETFTVKAILGILHNICRHVPNGKWKLRNDGLVSVVRLYLDSDILMIRLKSLIILSYILSEAENEMINSDDDNFIFIFKVLSDAMQSAGHKSSKYGMGVVEIMKGLNNLAINDENKIRIVRNGGLPLFQGILEGGSHDEVKVTITTLWSLAFHHYNKMKMREMPGIMSQLFEFQHCRDEEICHAARGTFWELENISKSSIVSSVSSSLSADKDPSQPHIMISYQWDSQAVMMKVKDRLRQAGYKVWMDIEHMTGSTLEAMALAVEKAAVVLVCMSQKYKDSPNCRTEAEYVYRLRKDFVPLRLQREYIPDGWLGILVGTRLYFDIYSEDQLDVQVPRLIRELRDRGKVSPSLDQRDLRMVPQRMTSREAVPILHHPASPTVTNWTPVDVKQWIGSIGLQEFIQNFEQFDGLLLLEIQRVQETAPEYFHNILRQDFNMPLTEALKLSRHLRLLT